MVLSLIQDLDHATHGAKTGNKANGAQRALPHQHIDPLASSIFQRLHPRGDYRCSDLKNGDNTSKIQPIGALYSFHVVPDCSFWISGINPVCNT